VTKPTSKNLGDVDRLEFEYSGTHEPLELLSRIKIGEGTVTIEKWGFSREAKIWCSKTAPEYAPFEPSAAPRVENLPLALCRRLTELIGDDFIAIIAGDSSILARETKFSAPRRKLIADACLAEQEIRQSEPGDVRALVSKLCQSGIRPGKARDLAEWFDPEAGSYQFLFSRNMTLLQADRFARLFNPVRAKAERPLALLAANFLDSESTILPTSELFILAWKNYQLSQEAAEAALQGLILRGAVRKFTFEGKDFYGLKPLVDAEEFIATQILDNPKIELSKNAEQIIGHVIKNAAAFLNRPGFELAKKQADAIWSAFQYRYSVLTGPPGTGKTAVCALINVIASLIYPDIDPPGRGVALAGRAASNLREAAVCWHEGKLFALEASTLHSALKVRSGDDDCRANGKIQTGVLFLDEASMVNSLFFAALLRCTDAEHFVFIGDPAQLPPIGCGKPFHDIVATNAIPITRLEHNYRTDCPGIQLLCDLVRDGDEEMLKCRMAEWAMIGGVTYLECAWNMKARAAGEYFANLVSEGRSIAEIAILTPRNQSDAGARLINVSVRAALGMPDDSLVAGDMLIVVQNNYKTPRQDGDGVEVIYNGERCFVTAVSDGFLDIAFPRDAQGNVRQVRLLMSNPDAGTADGDLPEGFAFGYAMSTHKAQGSQFPVVIAVTAQAYRTVGIVQRSNTYTALSRAQESLFILGDIDELITAAGMDERPRVTLLSMVLTSRIEF
jgi:hypothetical protein